MQFTISSLIREPANLTDCSLRLFCVPYAGGGASVYRKWSERLSSEKIVVCPVQLPGREESIGDRPYTNLMALVRDFCDALVAYDDDKPYALFGHSLGSLIVYEAARELESRGVTPPKVVVVSGHRAPHLVNPFKFMYSLSDDRLVEKLRELNGTPEEILQHEELMELLLPCIRADFEMLGTYSYKEKPELRTPLIVYGGRNDATVPLSELLSWRDQASSVIRIKLFEGDHFFPWQDTEEFLRALTRDVTKGVML